MKVTPLDLRQIGIRDSGDLGELPQGQLGILALLTQVGAEIGKLAHASIMLTPASRMQTLDSVRPNTVTTRPAPRNSPVLLQGCVRRRRACCRMPASWVPAER